MNRRGFLRSLALTAAAVAIGRGMGEPQVVPLAPHEHPLFSGLLGRYEGLTIRHINALRDHARKHTVRAHEYVLFVHPRHEASARRYFGSSMHVINSSGLSAGPAGFSRESPAS